MFKIAIIGRTNVGKSTFFNKLVGKSFAITDDAPGVTRDRKEARAQIGPIEFLAIDTAGLENENADESLERRMFEQTELAIVDADLCLFVVDAKVGVTNKDYYFAEWLRKQEKKVVLVANKCENFTSETVSWAKEYFKLGFGEPIGISAEHKLGFGDLYEKIEPHYEEYQKHFGELEESRRHIYEENADLQVAIIGRPNAGKSTLLNKILGEERLITGPEAGITRDSIAIDYEFQGKRIRFIDTAGIRKKVNIIKKLEKLSSADSFRAIRFAQVAILLLDANSLLDHQDMAIAGEVLKEGRAIVFAINKIDTVKGDKEVFLKQVRKQLQQLFAEVDGVGIIGISAKSGYNVEKMLGYVLKSYEQWQRHIPTRKLNEWLRVVEANHAPKMMKGKVTKLKYITQIKDRPPTFAVFTNHLKAVEGDYQRYLVNTLRKEFELTMTPVRMVVRKSDNPFAKKD